MNSLKSCSLVLTAWMAGLVLAGCAADVRDVSNSTGDLSDVPATTSGVVRDVPEERHGQPFDDDGVAAVNAAAANATINATIGDREAFDQLLAQHHGKVVLVDFWATWCGPCVQQFPHTVNLSKTSDPEQLAVISVSMDEPDNRDHVVEFLEKRGASFDNLISSYGVGQEGFESFEISDGAIPHYKIYDRTGKLRHTASSNEGIGMGQSWTSCASGLDRRALRYCPTDADCS